MAPNTNWRGHFDASPEEDLTPMQYFSMFIGDDIIQQIATEINNYAHIKDGITLNCKEIEIRQLFGIWIQMGIVNMPNTTMYWSSECRYTPVADVLSRNRFTQLSRYFHISDNTK